MIIKRMIIPEINPHHAEIIEAQKKKKAAASKKTATTTKKAATPKTPAKK